MNQKNTKRIYNAITIVLLLTAIGYACSHLVHWGNVEYTDDAQVYRHITPINTRVQGFIKEIRFEDYQHVRKGDTLVVIDDAEYRLQLAQAEAGLEGSRSGSSAIGAGMDVTAANVRVADAGIEEARVNMENAKADFERYASLLAKEAVTQQQYDHIRALYETARARYEQACSQKRSTALVVGEQAQRLSQTKAGVSVAEAQVNLARLNLSYTVVTATCDGVMGRKDIHEGQLVQPGQLLARMVDDDQVWVVANYRESQMRHIAVGSTATFKADAVPGTVYKGVVESIAAGTGATFSPIPTDNATGNFVKVEQRVPVRIRLAADNDAESVGRLLAGLNVETEVRY